MIKFTLDRNSINYTENLPINIKEVRDSFEPDVQKSIDNFNELYNWDKMFTTDEVEKRMENGQRFFLFYFNGVLVGHLWVSKFGVSYDYPEVDIREFHYPEIYAYNLFVDKRKHKKNAFDSSNYPNEVFNILFKEGYEKVHMYVDDWNVASLENSKKSGFFENNW